MRYAIKAVVNSESLKDDLRKKAWLVCLIFLEKNEAATHLPFIDPFKTTLKDKAVLIFTTNIQDGHKLEFRFQLFDNNF